MMNGELLAYSKFSIVPVAALYQHYNSTVPVVSIVDRYQSKNILQKSFMSKQLWPDWAIFKRSWLQIFFQK